MTHDEMIAVIAAHRDGKRILSRHRLHDSKSWGYSEPCWDFNQFDYRIAPEPKRVPLGPEDFPPGTAIRGDGARFPEHSWFLIQRANKNSFTILDCEYTYAEAMKQFERLLPGTNTWLPCWKEEEA